MIGLSFLSFGASAVVGFLAARLAASFTTRLRADIFNQVMDYSQSEIKGFSIPSLLTRTTNDLTQLQLLITMGLQVVTKGPIMAVWAMTKIADKSGEWMLAVIVAVFVLLLMLLVLLLLAFPKQRHIQTLTDKLNSITREILSGIRVVRAYNAESYQGEKFSKANDDVTNLNLFVNRLMALMNPVMTLISSGLNLAIYWIGASLINDAAMTDKLPIFSDMVVFSSYAMQVVIGFMLMVAIFIILPRSLVSAGRINEVLELDSSIHYHQYHETPSNEVGNIVFEDVSFRYAKTSEADKVKSLGNVRGHVHFEGVSFGYSKDKTIIHDFTAEAKPGQKVAIVGPTGAGKTIIVNLLMRFYDIDKGHISIDGTDTQSVTREAVHEAFSMVLQDTWLFEGTIRDNLIYNQSNITDDEVIDAAKAVGIHHFIMTLPKGYDTVLDDSVTLSVGQKQLLTIARALLKDAPLLILDEATSSVDTRTEELIQKAMDRLMEGRTSFVIAHRLSTIRNADLILVMKDGNIIEQGNHETLMMEQGFYADLYNSQFEQAS